MGLFTSKTKIARPEDALAGRDTTMPVPERHFVLGTPIAPPFPDGLEQAVFGLGCFWGAERKFWEAAGVFTTAVGYAGGFTPNPTYQEVCSGRTGHTEVVLVVFDPARISYDALLKIFWEAHDPTQGMRQGNDVGTQYRSAIYTTSDAQAAAAAASRDMYQRMLADAGYGPITTEIASAGPFYYAEDYHQQYLAKNPDGYCGLGGTGCELPDRHRVRWYRRFVSDYEAAYRDLRERVTELLADRTDAELEQVAPATPAWRVRDVVSHMAGVCDDIANGNMDGVATDAWTQAQVDKRRDWPFVDDARRLVRARRGVEPQMNGIGQPIGQMVFDAWTHEQDVRGALGVVGGRDSQRDGRSRGNGSSQTNQAVAADGPGALLLVTEVGEVRARRR